MEPLPILTSRYSLRLGSLMLMISTLSISFGVWWQEARLLIIGPFLLILGLWVVLDRRVKLRIDELGIYYSRWGELLIQWSEISSIEVWTYRGVDQVSLVPVHPSVLLERLPAWSRAASWMMWKLRAGHFVLSTAALEHGTAQLLEVLRNYHEVRVPDGVQGSGD